jgi:hypothetical protein
MKAYESHSKPSSGSPKERGGQSRAQTSTNSIRLYDVPQHEYVDPYRGSQYYDNFADRPYEAPYDFQREYPFVDQPYRQNFNGPSVGGNPAGKTRQGSRKGSGGCPKKQHKPEYPPYHPQDSSWDYFDSDENDEQIVVE